MSDILKMISDRDRIDFSRNFSIKRNYMGDRFFPDRKTENLIAEWFRISENGRLATMATVHGFDTEAEMGSRPEIQRVTVEKLFIKRKINQSERVRLLSDRGVSENSILGYIFDDMGRMAESVKTRTEAAKMELISSGKVTVKENGLDFTIDYGVPDTNKKNFDWSDTEHDILGDIQKMWDIFRDNGYTPDTIVTSSKIMNLLRKNTAVQKMVNSVNGLGMFVTNRQLDTLMREVLGVGILINDEQYRIVNADGSNAAKRYFPENCFNMFVTTDGAVGQGLWGVTPEELSYGPYTEKSQSQFITVTQWETPDPNAVWTKASGVFVPALEEPNSMVIGKIRG